MNKAHHQPRAPQREIAIITVSPRLAWSVSEIDENGRRLVELRILDRHADGTLSPSRHRSVFRPEHIKDLVAALNRVSGGAA